MRKIYYILSFIISIRCLAQNSDFQKDSTEFRRIVSNCFDTIEDKQAFKQQFIVVVKLGEKINKPFSLAHIKNLMSNYHNLNGAYDSSTFYLKEAIKILDRTNLYSMQSKCIWGISQNYFSVGDNTNGVKKLFEYLAFSKKHDLYNRQADAYYALANHFDLEGKIDLAMEYSTKGIEIARKNDLKKRLGELYRLKGTIFYSQYYDDTTYSKKSQSYTDSSLRYFNLAILIATEINDNLCLGNTYNNMMGAYEYKKEYKKAFECIRKSLEIAKSTEDESAWSEPYTNMSLAYIHLNDFKNAKYYLDTALYLVKKYSKKDGEISCYDNGMQIAIKTGDFKSAYQYLELKTKLNDSIYGTETTNKISELEIQYQTKEKESTIKTQKLKLEQRNRTIALISAIGLLLAIAAWLYYRSYKSKNALAFEQQQQRASLMVIESEQTERMRIARELHDGIGQKLTVLKMYASAEKEKNEKQLDLLDTTIQEVREISHKMIPEILSLGLIAAVRDLCQKVNSAGTIECSFICDELSQNLKLAENIDLSIYRIIQEIINNMLKHANAKNIEVKFSTIGNTLQITVNDDGKGFDVKKIKQSSGIGWSNIFTRASIIKAAVDVNSSEKGTFITLNLNI